jgi:acyl carrier protein
MTASLDPSTDPNRLLAVVAQVAREARPNVEAHVTLDSSLERDLGLDSLGVMELVADIEDRFAVTIPNDVLSDIATVEDVAKALVKLKAADQGAPPS